MHMHALLLCLYHESILCKPNTPLSLENGFSAAISCRSLCLLVSKICGISTGRLLYAHA